MRYSQLFGKSNKSPVKDSKFVSHQLLVKGGFIAESSAGRYFFLPLGWRVHDKIKSVIKKHMDLTGAQEMISPTLHPLELWKETNRTNTVGFELMTVKDRRGAAFALGGTAEEMFVDVVRKFQISYKDLPFTLYQFSNKFRDEMRARGGLLRVREFIMKDAYSFDTDSEAFKHTYELYRNTYSAIFSELGLNTHIVEADNGYIGGEFCHEYQVEHSEGEGTFFVSTDGSYCAHEDVATFIKEPKNTDESLKPYEEMAAQRGPTMEDGVNFHQLPAWQQLKDVMMVNEKNQLILAVIRGDLDVNEIKLAKATGSITLRSATTEEIRQIGSEPGFISPVGLDEKVMIVGDTSLRTFRNAYGGANKLNLDAHNINLDRDFSLDIEADIAMAKPDLIAPNGSGPLQMHRGIEVGNIFQLGTHYTTKMSHASYVDQEGTEKPYYMGCYGIGLGRTLAAVVETHHDEKGIIWPESIAPFRYHLISLPGGEMTAQAIYDQLRNSGQEVLWDDRSVSAGEKFADADLLGCPYRLLCSTKTGEQVEFKKRGKSETKLMAVMELAQYYSK